MSSSHRSTEDPSRPPLIPIRLLVLLTASTLAGTASAFLTWHVSSENPWATALAGLSTTCLALKQLHEWTPP